MITYRLPTRSSRLGSARLQSVAQAAPLRDTAATSTSLAARKEVVPPGRQRRCASTPKLARQHLQQLATQQSEHRVHLLAR
jgi:hypothetical protein